MKIMPLFFFLFAIQVTLLLFITNTTDNNNVPISFDDSSLDQLENWNPLGNYSTYGLYGSDTSYKDATGEEQVMRSQNFWDIMFEPGTSTNLMVSYILAFALLIGGLAFFPFINRSDLSMLSGPFIFMLLAPFPTFWNLFQVMNNQLGGFVCPANPLITNCWTANWISVIIVGPLAFAWVMACYENWTGRPMS